MSHHSHGHSGSDRRHGQCDYEDRRPAERDGSGHGSSNHASYNSSHRRSRSRERDYRSHDAHRHGGHHYSSGGAAGGGGGSGGSWRSGGQQQQQQHYHHQQHQHPHSQRQPWQSRTPSTGHGNRDANGRQHADVVLPVPLHIMRQQVDAEKETEQKAATAAAEAGAGTGMDTGTESEAAVGGDRPAATADSAAVAPPASSCAFVTLVMLGDAYIPGALVLAWSLRAAGTRAALVVLVSPDVSAAGRGDLARLFDRVVEVPLLRGRAVHQEWKRYTKAGAAPAGGKLYQWVDAAFTKLHVLGLTDFARVCLLDADMLCVARAGGPPADHPDCLWTLPAPAGICSTVADAAANGALHGRRLSLAQVDQSLSSYGMRGCLYLLRPNRAHLDLLRRVLAAHGGYGVNRFYIGADEKIITDLYADRWSHVHWRFGCNSWKADEKTLGGKAVFLHYVVRGRGGAGRVKDGPRSIRVILSHSEPFYSSVFACAVCVLFPSPLPPFPLPLADGEAVGASGDLAGRVAVAQRVSGAAATAPAARAPLRHAPARHREGPRGAPGEVSRHDVGNRAFPSSGCCSRCCCWLLLLRHCCHYCLNFLHLIDYCRRRF